AKKKVTAKPPPIAGVHLNRRSRRSRHMAFGNFGSLLALLLFGFLHNRLVCRVDGGFASIQFLDKLLGRLVAIFRGLPHLLGRFVSATGTKANGSSNFVSGLTLFSFRKFFLKLRSRSTRTCGLSPP